MRPRHAACVLPAFVLALAGLGCGAKSDLESFAPSSATPVNACGGNTVLPVTVGGRCGVCALWACAGPDELFCDDDERLNACGECGPVPEEICNDRDDDCDEVVDEGCVLRALASSEPETRVRLSGPWLAVDQNMRGFGGHIAIIDTRTREVRRAFEASSEFVGQYVAIDAPWVAYMVHRPLSGAVQNVRAFNLETGETVEPPSTINAPGQPNVAAGDVVFHGHDLERGDMDLYRWTPGTGALQRFDVPETSELDPDAEGDWLVFVVAPVGEEIFGTRAVALHGPTGERVELSEGLAEGWDGGVAIDQGRVVWHRHRGSISPTRDSDIYVYDLASRTRTRIDDQQGYYPRISGDLVCFSGTSQHTGSGGQWSDIGSVIVDLRSGRRRVMNDEGHFCDVDGRRVAWLALRRSLDPYYYDLLAGEP